MLVRFSIGLEAVEDLIADCEQALAALALAERRRAGAAAAASSGRSAPIANDIRSSRLAAAGRADPLDVEAADQRRQRHLHLQHRQVPAGADPRAGAERHRHPVGRGRAGAAVGGEPALRIELGGAGEVGLAQRVAAHRQEDQRAAGTRMSATVVSRSACSVSEGATGLMRIVSLAQASSQSHLGEALVRPGRRIAGDAVDLGARPGQASGWVNSSQIAQARVLAVVSSPASSIVMTLPETSPSVMPEPGSSAATIIASSRLAGAARRAGSASRRLRAAATKPSIAALTLSTLRIERAVGARPVPAPGREAARTGGGTSPGRSCRDGAG